MVKVKATPKFLQLAHKTITTEALQELIDELTINLEKGTLITGTGGKGSVSYDGERVKIIKEKVEA